MNRTKRNAYEIMMEHTYYGQIAGCIAVVDPKDGQQSVLVVAGDIPEFPKTHADSIAYAVLAIQRAHASALAMGMQPVY